ALEIGPAGQRRPRRPAVGAAGKAAELARVWLPGDWGANLEVPDRRATQLLSVDGRCDPRHHSDDHSRTMQHCRERLHRDVLPSLRLQNSPARLENPMSSLRLFRRSDKSDKTMSEYEKIYDAVVSDPRYQHNLDWGDPRPGHPEGTVRAHIVEIERNLE